MTLCLVAWLLARHILENNVGVNQLTKTLNREKLAEVLVLLRGGDHIKDADLQAAITTLKPVVETLRYLGQRYFLAYLDLFNSLERLENMKKSRKDSGVWTGSKI